MPIISFNISDSMKAFLKRMVGSKEYKNNSFVMRDALVRLMDTKEEGRALGDTLTPAEIEVLNPKLNSSILITLKNYDPKMVHKLNHLEIEYHSTILHKSTFCHGELKTITYILEDTMDTIQAFITELNAFEDLQSFRYIIHEPEN
ncbi:MAG: ribbon-helix-helix domain-containing protein [Promethearchaeota archaeon]